MFSRNAAVLAAVVLIATPASARSTVGIAYDSVTKLVDFGVDFRAGQHPSQSRLSVTPLDRWRYYFAPKQIPELACIDVAAPWLSRYGTPQRYEPELQRYFKARTSKMLGIHFSVIERRPELPTWRIVRYSVWQRFQRQSGVADSNYFFELQSGNIRSIDDDDPAFRLPSGFTKIPT